MHSKNWIWLPRFDFTINELINKVEGMKIGLVSLFNGISTFVGYLMPKLFF